LRLGESGTTSKSRIELSPAITLVLLSMLKVSSTIVSGWQGLERTTALFAVRKIVIGLVDEHLNATNRGDMRDEPDRLQKHPRLDLQDLDALDLRLSQVQLVDLGYQRIPDFKNDAFWIPKFGRYVVWINRAMASFADVVGPYMLLQAKFSIEGMMRVTVDIFDELLKCGLLDSDFLEKQAVTDENTRERARKAHIGWVTLTGLIQQWETAPEIHRAELISPLPNTLTSRELQNRSMFYPDNLLHSCPGRTMGPEWPYARIKMGPDNKTFLVDGNSHTCPSTLDATKKMMFIISTNCDSISIPTSMELPRVTGKKNKKRDSITLYSKNITNAGEVDITTLLPKDQGPAGIN
jgi:hypothetical protein